MAKNQLKDLEYSKTPSARISGCSEWKKPAVLRDDESIIGPSSEEMEDGLVLATNRGNTPGRRGWNAERIGSNRPVVVVRMMYFMTRWILICMLTKRRKKILWTTPTHQMLLLDPPPIEGCHTLQKLIW